MPEEPPLQEIREQIDALDRRLVAILAQRKRLVAEVARIKAASGLPVYVPSREAELIAARRAEAEAGGVSPELVEDLLRRIMRESYFAESHSGFKPTRPDLGPVVVIGGGSGMGRYFARMLTLSNYSVRVLERTDWDKAERVLAGAGMVIVAVPIAATLQVIRRLKGRLPANCLLTDVTSVKAAPMTEMLAVHPGPVLGLHPMFGPTSASFAKQLVVYCHGRRSEGYRWLLDQLVLWGAELHRAEAEEHDRMMAVIQAMRHFATFVYGIHLSEENADLDQLLAFSSPIYRLELGMVGRLFAQEPKLYADIIFGSGEGRALASRFMDRFRRCLAMLEREDFAAFEADFMRVRAWFGSHADRFLRESSMMLEKLHERSQPRKRHHP